ncbi:formate dehydrogenase accessory sulfurtransferase FdhD [Marinospirillum alkaliphilum]|uniref:Sulfur carrier protein FdhD n=1 Tax=Marinospirillum alkaliphilum DSM 21637 TaxID=1122209 RepID=A0A1K1ZTB6_9GAMM|nr:formate dehydrogenase accessory sulfurtransferase FdhD [Marinospirillum alkaliphilum]SFX77383.1 FdhD protein [Marinospirillum alkaliphilum DSM 21637]
MTATPIRLPVMSRARAPLTLTTQVMNEQGEWQDIALACERPLTLYLNKREIVTLMTLGEDPEALALGYLRNQGLVENLADIEAIQVDWEVEAAAIRTSRQVEDLEELLSKRTVTTGCGQGTVFGNQMARLEQLQLPDWTLKQSQVYALLDRLKEHNATYRNAGAVHGCAICTAAGEVLAFCEDIGRHNAVDTLAGHMWLKGLEPEQAIFYTTGRLTSEMVMKTAQMGISVVLSRSGATQMGLEIANRLNLLLLARAKGRHFQAFTAQQRLELDARPALRPGDLK